MTDANWPWPPPPNRGSTIHCCLCLNLDNRKMVPATTIVNGYAVCAEHADFMAQPFSDFAQLLSRLKPHPPGRVT